MVQFDFRAMLRINKFLIVAKNFFFN